MTYSDETVLKALKNSNEKAYTWIYNKYVHQLCSYAAKKVECMATAEDIVHDALAKLWKERETIRITKSLQAYLYICVRNKCWNYL